MLNYIWSGLIVVSLLFALTHDAADLRNNRYLNGHEHTVRVEFAHNGGPDSRATVHFTIPGRPHTFQGSWRAAGNEYELIVPVQDHLPPLWLRIAADQEGPNKDELVATVAGFHVQSGQATIVLPEVRFVKLRAITAAAFNMAEFAVTLAIGLIGIMGLWLGLMKVAEQSGLVYVLVKLVQPFLRFLFPNVPRGHPAHGVISLNMAANMMGLGNAATPLGIKAMEELQKLNPSRNTATNAQCMLLTVNTASVQLLPPATLVALIGTGVNVLVISMALATLVSLIVGVSAAKIYERFHPEADHLEDIPEAQKSEA